MNVNAYIAVVLTGLAFSAGCRQADPPPARAGSDSLVNEYQVDLHDSRKLDLRASSVYDRKTARLKERILSNGPDSVISRFIYDPGQQVTDSVKLLRDGVRIVIRAGNKEYTYLDGKLTSEAEFDTRNSEVRSVWYLDDSQGLSDEHRLVYDAQQRKISDSYFKDGRKLFEIRFSYAGKKLTREEYISATERPRGYPNPPDWIQYEYEGDRLARKIIVTDRTIPKPYKKKHTDFYNEVTRVTYTYDRKGRLRKRTVYTPARAFDGAQSVAELANTNTKVSERSVFRYGLPADSR